MQRRLAAETLLINLGVRQTLHVSPAGPYLTGLSKPYMSHQQDHISQVLANPKCLTCREITNLSKP